MTETKSNLQDYFNKIENNAKCDPYSILHSCILGGVFVRGDQEAQAIARRHVTNCAAVAAGKDLYQALTDNGSSVEGYQEIRLMTQVLSKANETGELQEAVKYLSDQDKGQIIGIIIKSLGPEFMKELALELLKQQTE
jgi:hypothetical protein